MRLGPPRGAEAVRVDEQQTRTRFDDTYYMITEVYYDDNGNPTSWAPDPHNPVLHCDDVDGLAFTVSALLRALDRPVLKVEGNKLVPLE